MLYVFQVDTGTMLTFDVNLAMESVSTLQQAISTTYNIPLHSQVLLISGGTPLTSLVSMTTSQSSQQQSPLATAIFPASSGSDTNPIFLFNKQNIENPSPPFPEDVPEPLDPEDDSDLPISFNLLFQRAKTAMLLNENGKELLKSCERLIHDQHLQHLGWAAVVANLEDVVGVFRKKEAGFRELCGGGGGEGEVDVEDVVERLPTILQQTFKSLQIPPELSSHPNQSLLDFLTSPSSSPSSSILNIPHQYHAYTHSILEPQSIDTLLKDASSVLEKSQQIKMRQIKGLSNRLFSLDQLLQQARTLFQDLNELNNSVQQTTNRCRELSDKSILPDLCSSHHKQLKLMKEHVRKLTDIRKRCLKAKEELILNLNQRLKWVIAVQKQISEINVKINVYGEGLRKFRRLKKIIKEIDEGETVFLRCLEEVARRRDFEVEYDSRLGKVKGIFESVFEKEREKRRLFFKDGNFKEHFLVGTLFNELLDEFPGGIFDGFQGNEKKSPLPGYSFPPIFNDDKAMLEKEIERLKLEKENEIQRVKDELRFEFEREMSELKERQRQEMEGFKARVRYVERNANARVRVGVGSQGEGRDVVKDREIYEETKEIICNQGEDVAKESFSNQGEDVAKESFSNQSEDKEIPPETNNPNDDDDIPLAIKTLSRKLKTAPSSSIKIGDSVMLFYNEKYEAFVVYAKTRNVHFVHTDCAKEMEKGCCYVGSVVDKEYCVARRAQNRYKVPQGFHFYRVKVLLVGDGVVCDFKTD